MQRYMPGKLPQNGDWRSEPMQKERFSPLQAVVALGEHVRTEHGRVGVQQLMNALSPFLNGELGEQAARQLGVQPPKPQPERTEHKPQQGSGHGAMDMERMLKLMQSLQSGKEGLDPQLLMQLMQNKGG